MPGQSIQRKLQRFEARVFRFWSGQGALVARIGLALFLLWEATSAWSPRGQNSPLDVAAQALSIMSVGRVTYAAAPHYIGFIDLSAAILLLGFSASRTLSFVSLLRFFFAIAPLLMLRDDLFSVFPLRPNPLGWGALATLALCGIVALVAAHQRWEKLDQNESTAELLAETPAQVARRLLAWKRFAIVTVPLVIAVIIAKPFFWPRYLAWFHNRQERAALDEKLTGQLLKKSMPPSAILNGRKITTWVYLPPGYDRSKERYPVVYVMHGMPGEVRDCFVKGRIQDAAEVLITQHKIRPIIIVGWDGEGPGGPADVTNYLDRPDYKMETFMVDELVPYVDRTYRTIPDARFRAMDGISAGGYGAPNLILKHPDIWKIASSHNGFYSPEDDADNMTDILGPHAQNKALWDANDPLKTLEQHGPDEGLAFYLDIGEGDDLLPEFKRFAIALKKQGLLTNAHIYPGRHTWAYWSSHFYDSLRFANENFPKDAKAASGTNPARISIPAGAEFLFDKNAPQPGPTGSTGITQP